MNNRAIIISMLILLVIMPSVSSLGISPGKSTLNFAPGRTETVQVSVINNDLRELNVIIYVDGELKDYIISSEKTLEFKEGESKKSFSYTINMPQTIEKPGINTAEITVTEIAKESKQRITASVGVGTKLFVNVPYPELYAEAVIKTKNVKKGEDLPFYINIYNLGNEPIKNASVRLDIYSADKKPYKTFMAESLSIMEKKYGELAIIEKSDGFTPGNYYVNATIDYDGKKIHLSSGFSVTDFLILLRSISVEDYKSGGIASFSIIVQNIGNRLVDDFVSRITLNDTAGNLVANTKSFKLSLEPEDTKKTNAYWDTKDITDGEYLGKISLNYEDEMVEKDIKTTLLGDKINVTVISPITGMVIKEEKSLSTESPLSFNNSPIIILLVIVIIALMVVAAKLIRKNNGSAAAKLIRKNNVSVPGNLHDLAGEITAIEKAAGAEKKERLEELKEQINHINKEVADLIDDAEKKK